MVRDMLRVMQLIETEMRSKLPQLDLKFILVGSVAEGTRTHAANELDVMAWFNILEFYPLLLTNNDPFNVKVSGNYNPMETWARNGHLAYERFHLHFLERLSEVIRENKGQIISLTEERIELEGESRDLQCCPRYNYDQCCYTHCRNCIFNVTQTKCGACLVFKWKSREFDRGEILTIDLIPTLAVKGMDLNQMMISVTKTLFTKRPANWLRYLTSFMNRDRVLPESYYQLFEKDSGRPIPIAMKLLHFGNDHNFIIRPAQFLGVSSAFLNDQKLKKCYARLKCLKTLLNVSLNSYFVKKVLLSDDMRGKTENQSEFELLKACLNHSDIRHKFKAIIDYKTLETSLEDSLPIIKR